MEQKLNMKFKIHIKNILSKTKSFDVINEENKVYLAWKYVNELSGSQDFQFISYRQNKLKKF